MPTQEFDAVFFVAKAPTIGFKDGLFHICYSIGKHTSFEVVMPPKAFLRARVLGTEVISQWRLDELPDESKVTRIKKR